MNMHSVDRGTTFRKSYRQLRSLRAHYAHLPVLLLSATLTNEIVQDVKDHLALDELKQVVVCPDRLVLKLYLIHSLLQ
jgi:superfamily II DNA helicase RecQ